MKQIIIGAISGGAITVLAILGVQQETKKDNPPSAPAEQICPDGWQDTSSGDGHLVVLSCSRGEWLVILNPDRSANYAWRDGASEFTFDISQVPEWPR